MTEKSELLYSLKLSGLKKISRLLNKILGGGRSILLSYGNLPVHHTTRMKKSQVFTLEID